MMRFRRFARRRALLGHVVEPGFSAANILCFWNPFLWLFCCCYYCSGITTVHGIYMVATIVPHVVHGL